MRSTAVRLYGIWCHDPRLREEGCIATLIAAIVPKIREFGYTDFIQGDKTVQLADLENAAGQAHPKEDTLAKLVECEARRLAEWAGRCNQMIEFPGCLAEATHATV